MKQVLIIAALLIAFAGVAIAQSQDKKSEAEQEVTALNRAWADAIVRGDMEALDRLFASDMTVTSGNGTIRNKAQEMDDLRPSADIKTYFFNTEDVRVRVFGNGAMVTGHAKWKINLKGRDIDNERRYTLVFVKQDGRWQIVAQQLSRIPPPQPQK
ncbi:MAG TPA: nuclear transport factor 2 family protein [Blastocatellia bacterium]|nr:nuclear transport factor 2 family protein [Blastocatellia bacterium]